MRVLSLFDGISCARVALERAGIKVDVYYASEIDKHAIAVSTKNWADIQQIGDVKTIKGADYLPIDLLIGGSPCVDLSVAKKGRKGLEGEHSSLFWEFVRIKKETNPKWFVLENVASMPKKDREVITREMGVEPILIDASLVSAQSRKRLFWTNIPGITQPADRGILLKDVLQPNGEVDERFVTKNSKSFCLSSTYSRCALTDKDIQHNIDKHKRTLVGHVGATNGQANRVYSTDGKSATLSANSGGSGAKTGLYVVGRLLNRRLDEEGKRHDGDHAYPQTKVFEPRTDGKSGTLTHVLKDNSVLEEKGIRRLTPIECERLQSLPDNYTEGVAMTNRYKCLGNAFNVSVVSHILSFVR
jgi:DNA (cytosine-5)-methyltransferase 3A